MAQLGRIVGQFGDGGGQDRIEDADRNLSGWFRDAILEFVPLGEWDDVLLRACQGPGEPGPRLGPAAVSTGADPPPALGREEPRVFVGDYLAGLAHHNGGTCAISATFRVTDPTEAQAMEWMTATVRHALRWGACCRSRPVGGRRSASLIFGPAARMPSPAWSPLSCTSRTTGRY